MHSRSSLAREGLEGTTRPGWTPTLQSRPEIVRLEPPAAARDGAAWQQAEHRYQLLLSTIAERVWRFALDPALPLDADPEVVATAILRRARLVECNPAWTHVSGHDDPCEIRGLWLPDVLMGTYPEQMELLTEFVRSGLRLVDVRTTEWDRSGHSIGVLTNLVGIVENDRLSGLWGAQRPLTPGDELGRQPHVFSRGLSDNVTIADGDGVILFESPGMERVLGFDDGERKGADLFAHIATEDAPGLREVFAQVLLTPGSTGPLTVLRARHRDATWRSHAVVVSHLDGIPGPPLLALSVLDVTAHTQPTATACRAGHPLDDGGAALSEAQVHAVVCELNNILTVIAGHAQLALQGCGRRSRLAGDLRTIDQAAARASGVVRALAAGTARPLAGWSLGPPAAGLSVAVPTAEVA